MKTVLVTGASSGFGKLATQQLLKHGHTVIAGVRGGDARLSSIYGDELKRYPGRLFAADLHLDREESMDGALKVIQDRCGGRLDVLVNNAGAGLMGAFEDQTMDQLRAQFELNFFGTMALTKKCLPLLRASKGRVISVSSVAGLFTFPFYGVYCASKFALESMMEGLYYQLKPAGVQVSLVEPGGFRTEFGKAVQFGERAGDPSSLHYRRSTEMIKFLEGAEARLQNPARVAKLITKLVERRRMPLRNPVGFDARLAKLAFALIPDSWRIRLIDFGFKKIVFKE